MHIKKKMNLQKSKKFGINYQAFFNTNTGDYNE